jgi:hypothetical protein
MKNGGSFHGELLVITRWYNLNDTPETWKTSLVFRAQKLAAFRWHTSYRTDAVENSENRFFETVNSCSQTV